MRTLFTSGLRPYVCQPCRRDVLLVRRKLSSKPSSIPEVYDVVCVGGGPAGLGLLAALKASPVTSKLKVALVESQDLSNSRKWNPDSNQYTNRCSSLTPSSVSFLQDIGAWQHVDSSRVQPYQEMQVWDGETGSRISFDWSGESPATPTVATMTENANLVRSLLSRIASLEDGNTSLFSNTTVAAIDNGIDHPDGPDLSAWPVLSLSPKSQSSETEIPKTIAARLLVGADGINSPVRAFADISTDGWDYNRHGVVATLDLSSLGTEGPHTAYQRFLPSLGGPIALLPLPNNHATLVWSTTTQNAAYLKSLPASTFATMINAAFRLSMTDLTYMLSLPPSSEKHADELSWRLQHTSLPPAHHLPPSVSSIQPGTIASFPLRHRHASTYISPRVSLIGDAAHVIHPLAGQGLNLGIGDVASLSRTIEYAMQHGMDIGDYLSLEQYPYERWGVNAKVGLACDLLHKVYNVPGNGPVAWGRSLGLDVVDKVPFMKSFFMKQAEG